MTLELRRFIDPAEFMRDAVPFLLKNEAMNSLPLRITGGLLTKRSKDVFLAIVYHGSEVRTVALQTPPHNLVLSAASSEAACSLLLGQDDVLKMPGVIGPKDAADLFSVNWQKRKNGRLTVTMEMGAYELRRLEKVPIVAGRLRKAEQADLPFAASWMKAFRDEVLPSSPVESNVDLRGYYFWELGGTPVCAVRALPSTPNGAVINDVYTPPAFRKRGFATAAVFSATARMLAEGCKMSFLFTDLANPTSNAIYRRIGYRQVGEFRQIRLELSKDPE